MLKTRFWEKQKPPPAIISPNYFQGHDCHLPSDKLSSFGIRCSKLRSFLLELTAVRTDDIRARNMYRSYAALSAEKYRQYLYHPLSIHPYSKLRLWLDILFVITTLISNGILSMHYATITSFEHKDYCMSLIYISDSVIIMNVLANFFTGYVEGDTYTYVVLDLKKVFCKYTSTWFIVDLLSAISFLPGVLHIPSVTSNAILEAMRLFRLPVQYIYFRNISLAFQFGIRLKTFLEVTITIATYIMWNIYFQFATEYIFEGAYVPKSPRDCSWISMAQLWNATSKRFLYSLERSIFMLRKNSNMNLEASSECSEGFYVVSWIIAKILIYHAGLKYIIAMYGHESSAAKYFTMTRQVEMYVTQMKLPPRIKKKILKFYAIRYQSCFFVEAPILSCVSGQLREDIIMHTGRQLVRQLEFLKKLPRTLLLQMGFKLKLVIFIAGDIIFKINTIGDCLYFIDKGTVAVYSGSGLEVCHLEDGDFFGEIALVMKHRFRTTSVVAVTNCELFRLDREDFNSSIACYPTVYEDIKKVATHRQERTSVIDEQHNIDMKNVEVYTNERL